MSWLVQALVKELDYRSAKTTLDECFGVGSNAPRFIVIELLEEIKNMRRQIREAQQLRTEPGKADEVGAILEGLL